MCILAMLSVIGAFALAGLFFLKGSKDLMEDRVRIKNCLDLDNLNLKDAYPNDPFTRMKFMEWDQQIGYSPEERIERDKFFQGN